MRHKQRDQFIRFYDRFKKLVPFMMEKNMFVEEDEDVSSILNLPKIETLKAELARKLENSLSMTIPEAIPETQEEYETNDN